MDGIHREKLETDELIEVLKKYNIIEIPDQPSAYRKVSNKVEYKGKMEFEIIKDIYYWALHVVLLNGHWFSLKWNSSEFVDSTIYLNDMIMLLYLYEINKSEPLCLNHINISPKVAGNFYKIEQSGYGNILGLRREKDKCVIFKSIPPKNEQNEIIEGISEVKRRTDVKKAQIPYACKDVLSALLLSIKFNNPFIFNADKEETPLKKYTAQEIIQTYLGNKIPLEIVNDNIQKMLISIINPNGVNLMEKVDTYWHSSYNRDALYRFHNRYYNRLEALEKKKANNELALDSICLRKANRYLSEILFGYRYSDKVVQYIKEKSNKLCSFELSLNNFRDVIYSISEYPICFARIKHMEQNSNKYFSPEPQKYIPKKKAEKIRQKMKPDTDEKNILIEIRKKLKKEIIKQENYTKRKFLPALFYCFLYYYETNESIKKASNYNKDLTEITENFVKNLSFADTDICDFEMYSKGSFNKFASNPIMSFLWEKRKKEYFRPLIYSPEKALF